MAGKVDLGLIVNVLLIIGGLNWGLVGLVNVDVLTYLPAVLARIVYVVVGLAALYKLYAMFIKK
ncbi:DUF378 domain-containing protein [Candidatus Woesearchaeota archaeon]|nr:DUF378 domain-containing protein [Candidatus Woesearchaeota archaeon]